jgi:hypothetical protein
MRFEEEGRLLIEEKLACVSLDQCTAQINRSFG